MSCGMILPYFLFKSRVFPFSSDVYWLSFYSVLGVVMCVGARMDWTDTDKIG